jgi:hypothetical protein
MTKVLQKGPKKNLSSPNNQTDNCHCRKKCKQPIFHLFQITEKITPTIDTIIKPDAFIRMPSSRLSLALIWSYRKAHTASWELSLDSVSEILPIFPSQRALKNN